MKIYFRWEKTMFGRWEPVCYHGDPPRPPAKEDENAKTRAVEVPTKFIAADGTPNFGEIVKWFKEPAL
jgi:hypothetical protein